MATRRRFKSGLELRLAEGPLKKLKYEPFSIPFTMHKDYTPDFVGSDKNIWYEAKGRARTFDEMKKYLAIKEQYPQVTLRFIITNPNVKAYPQVKLTLGEWLTKHGFEWCTEDKVPKSWRK